MSFECVSDCRVEMWSGVSAAQMQNITSEAIGGISLDDWNVIPVSALTLLTAEQGIGFLNFNLCRVFTDEQFSAFPYPFIANLEGPKCIRTISPEAYTKMRPIQMKGLQRKIEFVNPDGFFNMNPDVWSNLDDGLAYVCPYLEPEWVRRLKPSLFYHFPASCALNMPVDAWAAVSASQISQVSLRTYSDYFTWPQIMQLNDSALAVIGEDSWNVLGYQMNSTILSLTTQQIFRLVHNAPGLLNYETERATRVPFGSAALISLKAAIEADTTGVKRVPWPAQEEIGLFDGWTWMHFAFLNISTVSNKTGMRWMQQDRITISPVTAKQFVPFAGIRASTVAVLFSNVSILELTNSTIASEILSDTFGAFTAEMINNMAALAAVPAANWAAVAPSEIAKIDLDVWRALPSNIPEDLTCPQVNALDRPYIYELFNAKEEDPIVKSFRVAMERCKVWNPTLSNWKVAALIVGVGVGACVVSVLAVAGVVFVIRRRRGIESAPLLVQ